MEKTIELEARVRDLEQKHARIQAQLEPLLTLAPAIATLSGQLADLKSTIAGLKGQAVILGAIATIVAPILCGLVLKH